MVELLKSLSRIAFAIALLCLCSGCAIAARPFGYVQVWSDRNSYGDPAIYFERVRTDMPPRYGSTPIVRTSESPAPNPPEQSRSNSEPKSVADSRVPEGLWIFQ